MKANKSNEKNIFVLIFVGIILLLFVIFMANGFLGTGMMSGFNMMGYGGFYGMSFYMIFYFILIVLIFALIFWWVYKILVEKK